ncbi:MAG: FAD-dependent oxidoreductase [Sutterellaceae bacterium]|nr:FAD-dependent oxidoreductase [Sutterellaceae bacterium]MDD7441102.1 FAD-dependent oxidoreductase [Sutterellaceae bacterium]MDY2867372.1 FAD-dependent oxidoreductase [Mesosutterella sp.]
MKLSRIAAALAAGILAAGTAGAVAPERTDVVIVGAGGAGMSAAIEAREAGAKVVLLEKLPFAGGSTLLASTAFNAGGSAIQMKMAKPYTADDYYRKLLKGAKGKELENVRQLVDLSGPTADWLVSLGADLGRVINGSQHTRKAGGAFGAMLAPVLLKRVEELRTDLRTNSPATGLVIENGRVSGVRVKGPKGEYEIRAKAVVLAAGGFASNPELVARFSPQWKGFPSTASVGDTGDGILMAEKAGAALSQLDLTGPQTVAYDTGHGAVSLTAVRYNGAILVNSDGRRFTNELGNTAVLGKAIASQKTGHAWLVFDQASVDHAKVMEGYRKNGYFVSAEDPAGLARKLGLPEAALSETISRWHAVFDSKQDTEFGRKDSIFSRIDRAPYYGAKVSPASQITFGGVMRDLKARAVRPDGTPVPGLYVAGETASQYGQGLTIAVCLGRLAGKNAALEALGTK